MREESPKKLSVETSRVCMGGERRYKESGARFQK